MNKILITGSTGFVGINLIKYLVLNSGAELISVNRTKKENAENAFTYKEFFDGDIKAHHYIHLAGKAHDLKKSADDAEYFKVNYGLTKEIFEKFLIDDTAKTFIYISSVKAAKDSVKGILTEEHVPDPKTAYGKSKLKAEQYLMANLPEDKNVFILRPCMIHGPYNKGNLNLLYGLISKGLPYPLGAFENRRSFLSIENLCFLIDQLIKKPIKSGIYNIADDKPLSTNEVIKLMGEATGKKAKILSVPKPLIFGLVKMGDLIKLPLNSERLQKLTENYVVSNKKLLEGLATELPLSSSEGLRQTFNSFK